MKKLLWLLVAAALVAGGAYVVAGRAEGPAIDILRPVSVVGTTGELDVTVDSPDGRLSRLDVTLEQNGGTTPLFSLGAPSGGALQQETPRRVRLTRGLNKHDVPGLAAGAATVVVRAARPVLFGLRTATSEAAREIQVRLEPPRLAVLSTHHYINLGGSEMVVYRVTPPDVESGVRVGDLTYRGYPATGVHLDNVSFTDPAMKVAFFALRYDQDLNTPITVYARDEAGNEASEALEHQAFSKTFKRSRIDLPDTFLDRVVPAIYQHEPDLDASGDTLAKFLVLNGEVRRQNAETIAALDQKTAPETLWSGPFQQLANTKVEASFADHRTYFYKGKEVDQQVHLGFDLASVRHAPVRAGNAGTIVYAAYLGIYGNAIVIDHGMGVQSLYGHLSELAVKVGDRVARGQEIGRSGETGLAGGDHLHFTILVGGQMVSPMEWWDPHWIQDRIYRKLHEAAGR